MKEEEKMKFEKELTDFFESKEQTCTIDKKTLIKLPGNQSGYTVVYMVPSDIFAPRHFNLKPVYVLDEYGVCQLSFLDHLADTGFYCKNEISLETFLQNYRQSVQEECLAYLENLEDTDMEYDEKEKESFQKRLEKNPDMNLESLSISCACSIPCSFATITRGFEDMADLANDAIESFFENHPADLKKLKADLVALDEFQEKQKEIQKKYSEYPRDKEDLAPWFQMFFRKFSGKSLRVTYELGDGSYMEKKISKPNEESVKPYFAIIKMEFGRKVVYERTDEIAELAKDEDYQISLMDGYDKHIEMFRQMIPETMKSSKRFFCELLRRRLFYYFRDLIPDWVYNDLDCCKAYLSSYAGSYAYTSPFHISPNHFSKFSDRILTTNDGLEVLLRHEPSYYFGLDKAVRKRENVVRLLAELKCYNVSIHMIASDVFSTTAEQKMIEEICEDYPDFCVHDSLAHLSKNPNNAIYCALLFGRFPKGTTIDEDQIKRFYDTIGTDTEYCKVFQTLYLIHQTGYPIQKDRNFMMELLMKIVQASNNLIYYCDSFMIPKAFDFSVCDADFWIEFFQKFEDRNFFDPSVLDQVLARMMNQLPIEVQIEITKKNDFYAKRMFFVKSCTWHPATNQEKDAELIAFMIKQDPKNISLLTEEKMAKRVIEFDHSLYSSLPDSLKVSLDIVKELEDEQFLLDELYEVRRYGNAYHLLNNKDFIRKQMTLSSEILKYMPTLNKTMSSTKYLWNDVDFVMEIIRNDKSNIDQIPENFPLWTNVEFAKALYAFDPSYLNRFPKSIQDIVA